MYTQLRTCLGLTYNYEFYLHFIDIVNELVQFDDFFYFKIMRDYQEYLLIRSIYESVDGISCLENRRKTHSCQ